MTGPENLALLGALRYKNGDGGRTWSLLTSGPVEIYFVGASVTAQKSGWADVFHGAAKEETGLAHTIHKNAMGGVGLMFGVANYTPPKPGVPRVGFIEFSTGDLNLGLTPLDKLPLLLSELVARMLADNTLPIVVHNWRADYEIDDKAGVRRIYDDLATRFGIPVIENHRWIQERFDAGDAQSTALFRDVCHPTPDGSAAYARHTLACLRDMATKPPASEPSRDQVAVPPVRTMFSEVPEWLLLANGARMTSYTYPGTGQEFPVAEFSAEQTLRIRATGKLLGVAFISGPRAGWTELKADGALVRRFRCFDRHSYYQRYILLPAERELDDTMLELRVTEQDPEVSMASKAHADFELPRTLQFVHLIGNDLSVSPCP